MDRAATTLFMLMSVHTSVENYISEENGEKIDIKKEIDNLYLMNHQ